MFCIIELRFQLDFQIIQVDLFDCCYLQSLFNNVQAKIFDYIETFKVQDEFSLLVLLLNCQFVLVHLQKSVLNEHHEQLALLQINNYRFIVLVLKKVVNFLQIGFKVRIESIDYPFILTVEINGL